MNALETAIISNDLTKLRPFAYTIPSHPNVDKLLLIAAKLGNDHSIRFLLKHHKYPPLILAALLTDPKITFSSQLLIIASNIGFIRQLNIVTQYRLLRHAIVRSDCKFFELLLVSGVTIENTDYATFIDGRSPLTIAIETNKEQMALLLLASGAKLSIRCNSYSTRMTDLINAVRQSTYYDRVHIDDVLNNTRSTFLALMRHKLIEATIAEYELDRPPDYSYLSLLPRDILIYHIYPLLDLFKPTFNTNPM